jgi:acetylornithine deacetylase/succinyl-diaminopimelate desuccinylase-like protein
MEVENLLSNLIKNQSVNPPDGEMAVANYFWRFFNGLHIANEIIADSSGRGNFIATIGDGENSLVFSPMST